MVAAVSGEFSVVEAIGVVSGVLMTGTEDTGMVAF